MARALDYRDIEKLLFYFDIREKDIENLKTLEEILVPYVDEFATAFYNNLMRFEEINEFIEKGLESLKVTIKDWYKKLFSGRYDSEYLTYLVKIAKIHVEVGVPPHYIIVAMNFVSRFCTKRIVRELLKRESRGEKVEDLIRSLQKILALNEDVLISFYVDSEIKTFLGAGKLQRGIINFTRKFAVSTDIAILLGLMILAIFVMGLFVLDILHFIHGNLSHGLIAALGDLLILWTVLELLNSEIKFMMGGELAVSAFVSVALAATIREALVLSLEHEKPVEFKLGIGLLILILGVVYGIVKWFELKRRK